MSTQSQVKAVVEETTTRLLVQPETVKLLTQPESIKLLVEPKSVRLNLSKDIAPGSIDETMLAFNLQAFVEQYAPAPNLSSYARLDGAAFTGPVDVPALNFVPPPGSGRVPSRLSINPDWGLQILGIGDGFSGLLIGDPSTTNPLMSFYSQTDYASAGVEDRLGTYAFLAAEPVLGSYLVFGGGTDNQKAIDINSKLLAFSDGSLRWPNPLVTGSGQKLVGDGQRNRVRVQPFGAATVGEFDVTPRDESIRQARIRAGDDFGTLELGAYLDGGISAWTGTDIVGSSSLGANLYTFSPDGEVVLSAGVGSPASLTVHDYGTTLNAVVVMYADRLAWGDGSSAPDVTLRRAAAKTLEIPNAGGGLRLTSPDGAVTKTLTINNAGALTLI